MSDISYSAIILAAGEGSRLAANGVPRFFKPLLQVNGKFLIEHSLDFARQWGINIEIIVTSAVLKPILSESVSKDSIYYFQPEPTGLMDAIRIAMKSVRSDYVLILCADNTYGKISPEEIKREFEEKRGPNQSAVVTNIFQDVETRKRLTGFGDGRLVPRGLEICKSNWMGPLIMHVLSLNNRIASLTPEDILKTTLLEQHLNEAVYNNFLELKGDCVNWGVLTGKENIVE